MAGAVHGILVGYDGSDGSENALTWAAREARARGRVLTVCQAWALGYPTPPAEVAALDLARQSGERTLACGMRHARAVMGSSEVRPLLAAGAAAPVLCERSADADMVVMGSRGLGRLAGLLLGSVSSQVAAYASGRVVVVRGHWQPAAGYVPGPIVVGVDGSAACLATVAFAAEEAELREAALLGVCALADSAGSLGGAHLLKEDFEQAMGRCEKEHPGLAVHRSERSESPVALPAAPARLTSRDTPRTPPPGTCAGSSSWM